MIAVWVLIITGGVFLIRYLVRTAQRWDREESSGEILKRRYARGEISKEGYQEKRKDLASGTCSCGLR